MRISKHFVILAVLAVAFAALSGCSPCKDYKAIIADQEMQITDLNTQVADREAKIAEAEQLAADLRENIAKVESEKDVLVEQLNEVVMVRIPENVLFGSGQVMILDTMVPTLEALRDAVNEYPEWDVFVEGYTDNKKVNLDWVEVWPTNWELGAARAAAVTRYMTNQLDMDAERFAVVSYGPFRPVADNTTPEGREQNRFVKIVLHKPER